MSEQYDNTTTTTRMACILCTYNKSNTMFQKTCWCSVAAKFFLVSVALFGMKCFTPLVGELTSTFNNNFS